MYKKSEMKTFYQNKLLFLFLSSFASICSTDAEYASPFPTENVILQESWIQQREFLNIEYLKSLEPDRLLHNFKTNAGLPSSATPLEGWEAPGIGLRGHFTGHYLSAASFAVKKYQDPILCKNLDYMIEELSKCQMALGKGYLSAFPETDFDILETSVEGVWAPYYTYHKIMQGLMDVFINTDNKKAYDMLLGMADYVEMRMSKLNETAISKMLYTTQANPSNEPGGMNEILYKLYNLSKDEKHLKLAQIFDRKWFLMPLANNEDILSGLHSNTHIALVNGFAEGYNSTGNPLYYNAVINFWNMLSSSHSYVNGSSSGPRPNPTTPTSLTAEHWGTPNQLSRTLTSMIAESCVSHNTQKLSGKLFEWTGHPQYAGAYMNTFYNSIMALQNAKTGEFVYHLPLASPSQKKFLNNYSDFRCCNGSSIEAFSLLNNNIYFHKEKNLWINLYIPTKLNWNEYDLEIYQEGNFIQDHQARLNLKLKNPQSLSLNLFIPSWSKNTKVCINDELECSAAPNSFFTLNRKWSDNDYINIDFDFDFRIESMSDDPNRIAIFYGPMLLAFLHPSEISLYGTPDEILPHLRVSNPDKLEFTLENSDKIYNLKPLFAIQNESYSVYVRSNKLSDHYY